MDHGVARQIDKHSGESAGVEIHRDRLPIYPFSSTVVLSVNK